MCADCFYTDWPDGAPASAITDDVRSLAAQIVAHYRAGNETGGRFHVHLDDDNCNVLCTPYLSDPPTSSARTTPVGYGDPTPEEIALAEAWDARTEAERQLAIGLAFGYAYAPDGTRHEFDRYMYT